MIKCTNDGRGTKFRQRNYEEDLGMRKVSAKMVPQILSDDQKQWRLDVCCDLSHQLAEGNNFLDRVIMGDKSWCFQYDLETKRQRMQ
jgi:hypothetical protein